MRMINDHDNYGKSMYISSSLNGMLVQEDFYNEMHAAFVTNLCSKTTVDVQIDGLSNYDYDCYCSGFGFGGMPSIYIDTSANSTNVF